MTKQNEYNVSVLFLVSYFSSYMTSENPTILQREEKGVVDVYECRQAFNKKLQNLR